MHLNERLVWRSRSASLQHSCMRVKANQPLAKKRFNVLINDIKLWPRCDKPHHTVLCGTEHIKPTHDENTLRTNLFPYSKFDLIRTFELDRKQARQTGTAVGSDFSGAIHMHAGNFTVCRALHSHPCPACCQLTEAAFFFVTIVDPLWQALGSRVQLPG